MKISIYKTENESHRKLQSELLERKKDDTIEAHNKKYH